MSTSSLQLFSTEIHFINSFAKTPSKTKDQSLLLIIWKCLIASRNNQTADGSKNVWFL